MINARLLFYQLLYSRPVKPWLERVPYVRRIYLRGWWRTHPIDVLYDIDTSGFVPRKDLHPDETLTVSSNPYAGSEPSVIRWSLSKLGRLQDYHFIDLGCGKGRALVIGSEKPFRTLTGVEISPHLVKTARINTGKIIRQIPERKKASVVEGDILDFDFPPGRVAVFIYNSFGRETIVKLIDRFTARLSGTMEHLFIVYNNPVYGDLFDRSTAFTRWCADMVPHDPHELGYGPDAEDAVVIWQSVRGAYPHPYPRAQREIVITRRLWKAELRSA